MEQNHSESYYEVERRVMRKFRIFLFVVAVLFVLAFTL